MGQSVGSSFYSRARAGKATSRWGAVFFAAAAFFFSAPTSGAEKIVSAGLCADQMVIPLVERDRIVGVSPQAVDPLLSPVATEAGALRVIPPSAESLMLAGADTVVMDSYGEQKTERLLRKLGVRVVRVPYDDTLDNVPQSILSLGDTLGVRMQAEALAADFTARLERLPAHRPETVLEAVYIRSDGGSAGAGTHINEAMERAGYRNIASRLGLRGWGRLNLEALIMDPPQIFMTSTYKKDDTVTRQTYGQNPAFRRLSSSVPQVKIPGSLLACGGWPMARAAEFMATAHPMPDRVP